VVYQNQKKKKINSCHISNLPLSPSQVQLITTEEKKLQNLSKSHKKLTEFVCAGQARPERIYYLQPHYGNGVFSNVYLSDGQH
jgi:hypothetical protein